MVGAQSVCRWPQLAGFSVFGRRDIQLIDLFQIPVRRFDLVPVEVTDEAAVIGFAVFGTRTGLAFADCAGVQGGLVEGMHGGLVWRDKAEVSAVADSRRLTVDWRLHPEFRVFAAVGHRTGVGENAFAAKGWQYLIVEGHGLVELVGAERYMRQAAGVGVGHGGAPWRLTPNSLARIYSSACRLPRNMNRRNSTTVANSWRKPLALSSSRLSSTSACAPSAGWLAQDSSHNGSMTHSTQVRICQK